MKNLLSGILLFSMAVLSLASCEYVSLTPFPKVKGLNKAGVAVCSAATAELPGLTDSTNPSWWDNTGKKRMLTGVPEYLPTEDSEYWPKEPGWKRYLGFGDTVGEQVTFVPYISKTKSTHPWSRIWPEAVLNSYDLHPALPYQAVSLAGRLGEPAVDTRQTLYGLYTRENPSCPVQGSQGLVACQRTSDCNKSSEFIESLGLTLGEFCSNPERWGSECMCWAPDLSGPTAQSQSYCYLRTSSATGFMVSHDNGKTWLDRGESLNSPQPDWCGLYNNTMAGGAGDGAVLIDQPSQSVVVIATNWAGGSTKDCSNTVNQGLIVGSVKIEDLEDETRELVAHWFDSTTKKYDIPGYLPNPTEQDIQLFEERVEPIFGHNDYSIRCMGETEHEIKIPFFNEATLHFNYEINAPVMTVLKAADTVGFAVYQGGNLFEDPLDWRGFPANSLESVQAHPLPTGFRVLDDNLNAYYPQQESDDPSCSPKGNCYTYNKLGAEARLYVSGPGTSYRRQSNWVVRYSAQGIPACQHVVTP